MMREKKPSDQIATIFSKIYDNQFMQWKNWVDAILTYLDEQYILSNTILYSDPDYILAEINDALEELKLGRRSRARKLLLKLKVEVETREQMNNKKE